MLEHVTKLQIIPENYYGTAMPNEEVYFSTIITCLGICLIDTSGFKSFVHLADLYGFPIKKLAINAHPLPYDYWQNHKIFDLLKTCLPPTKIEKAIIFGNYKNSSAVFNISKNLFDYSKVTSYVASILKINKNQVTTFYFKNSDGINIKITADSNLEIIPDEDLQLYDIESANREFYEQHLGRSGSHLSR